MLKRKAKYDRVAQLMALVMEIRQEVGWSTVHSTLEEIIVRNASLVVL